MWEKSFEYHKDILVDNKIWELQFKILHRIVGTNRTELGKKIRKYRENSPIVA